MNDPIYLLSESLTAELSTLEKGNAAALQNLKSLYMGKKGRITELLKAMGALPAEERPAFGKRVNELRDSASQQFEVAEKQLEEQQINAALKSSIDPTLPGKSIGRGSLHPVYQVREATIHFFRGLGFKLAQGPEVETDWYNFEALNIPPHHPARDMQDTFYVDQKVVLRTQTSGVQIHTMENEKPPLRIIAPGHVYRADSDASHAPMFQQVEGLVVDKNISFAELKGTLYLWAKYMFGENAKIRFRPSFFPFTEPSAEMDVSCSICGGSGCRACKHSGWIEILGCGSVNPRVFESVGIDPEEYTGFAFGFGLDRVAMLRYGIPEIGLLSRNEIPFLQQF